YYSNVLKQVNSGLPSNEFIVLMEKFYQQHFDEYNLIPSLTIPPTMGFGVQYRLNNKTKIFNAFGSLGIQNYLGNAKPNMGFGNKDKLRELSTHEFGHSFVNHVIDSIDNELIAQTEKLFIPVKSGMVKQGYTTWRICLYEHFVRAGEIIIANNLGNKAGAEQLRFDYIIKRKFIYLPVIIKVLERYNTEHNTSYPEAVKTAIQKLNSLPE
ncbi:MAG: DUF4932 domain-containing protein, partial [Sphingobacteriaceae bacterium]